MNYTIMTLMVSAGAAQLTRHPRGVARSVLTKVDRVGQSILLGLMGLDPRLLIARARGGHICPWIFVCIEAGYGCLYVGWVPAGCEGPVWAAQGRPLCPLVCIMPCGVR